MFQSSQCDLPLCQMGRQPSLRLEDKSWILVDQLQSCCQLQWSLERRPQKRPSAFFNIGPFSCTNITLTLKIYQMLLQTVCSKSPDQTTDRFELPAISAHCCFLVFSLAFISEKDFSELHSFLFTYLYTLFDISCILCM